MEMWKFVRTVTPPLILLVVIHRHGTAAMMIVRSLGLRISIALPHKEPLVHHPAAFMIATALMVMPLAVDHRTRLTDGEIPWEENVPHPVPPMNPFTPPTDGASQVLIKTMHSPFYCSNGR
jgi:hypothetical protein